MAKQKLHKLVLIVCLSCVAALPNTASAKDYQLRVSKKNKELIVERSGEIVKRYQIASGKGGKGTKRRQGDGKTPLGTYRILSFKDSDRFHFFMQLDYPNLIDAWYGYKNKIISAEEFKQIATAYKQREKPPQDTGLGGFIGIHGIGETTEKKLAIHENLDWTDGCIALTNEEVLELRQYVDVGTQIVIAE